MELKIFFNGDVVVVCIVPEAVVVCVVVISIVVVVAVSLLE